MTHSRVAIYPLCILTRRKTAFNKVERFEMYTQLGANVERTLVAVDGGVTRRLTSQERKSTLLRERCQRGNERLASGASGFSPFLPWFLYRSDFCRALRFSPPTLASLVLVSPPGFTFFSISSYFSAPSTQLVLYFCVFPLFSLRLEQTYQFRAEESVCKGKQKQAFLIGQIQVVLPCFS